MTSTNLLELVSLMALVCSSFSVALANEYETDTIPPTTPPTLIVSNISETSMDLEWSASGDNVGVVSYKIYNRSTDVVLATTDGQTFSKRITGLEKFARYNFSIVSIDAAGNESMRKYAGWHWTLFSCNTNKWVGGSANWNDDKANWSENLIPHECHNVIIDNGSDVMASNAPPEIYEPNSEYLISTFEVKIGSSFTVERGAEFHVIPSKPGPYNLSGTYEDPNPDCYDPLFCECCISVTIYDDEICWYSQSDYSIFSTYEINGNILYLTFDGDSEPSLIYRIIDDNSIVQFKSADVLYKN